MSSAAGSYERLMVDSASLGADKASARAASRMAIAALGTALFLTMLPVTMMVPVVKELVTERFHPTPFWTHSFMAVNMIGAVLAAPLGGALADRLGRRKPILMASLAVNALLVWAMSMASSLPALLTIRFFEGAAHIMSISTLMALAADRADPNHRGRTMGVIGATLMFGTACGAPLGGRIGQHMPLLVFPLGAGFALAAMVVVALCVRETPGRQRLARLADAFDLIGADRDMLVPYAYAFIDRFSVGVIVSSFVLYLGEIHAMSPAQRGGLLALFMLPFAVLCYPVGRLTDRFGRVLPMCVGNILFGLVYASYGLIPAGWLPAAMLVSGVLSAIMFAPNLAMCSDLAPADKRATAYAGLNMAGSLGFILGPLVGGTICGQLSWRAGPLVAYQTAFIVAGASVLLCALVTIPLLLDLRRRGRTR